MNLFTDAMQDVFSCDQDNQAQAEMNAEREQEVEWSLRVTHNVLMDSYLNGKKCKRVLEILCRECGIPYDRIVGKQ